MSYTKLLKKIEQYINSFYIERADPRLLFHSYSGTLEDLNRAEKISKFYHLDEPSMFIVCAAVLFKNTGYHIDRDDSSEIKSADLAENFLKSSGAVATDITEVRKCILAAARLHNPGSLPEKIVCDATTFYYGNNKFKEKQRLLKNEIEAVKNISIDGSEWCQELIKMLANHYYYTDYCKALLDEPKEKHLNKLKNKQLEKTLESDGAPFLTNGSAENENDQDVATETKRLAPSKDRPVRGVETMFRISSSNSQKISSMADNKAHIMISVNSIIISVVLGLMVRKLDENTYLIIPTIILLIVNVATIVYSVLATRQ